MWQLILQQPLLLANEGDTYIIDFAELPAQLIFHALMVLILFFVLGALIYKPVLEMLKKRADAIQSNIDAAESNKQEAEKLRTEYEEKMEGAAREREAILSDAYKAAQAREESIVKEARAEADAIRERSRKDLAQEQEKVRAELKAEAVDLAAMMAEKALENSLTDDERSTILQKSLKEMEEASWQK